MRLLLVGWDSQVRALSYIAAKAIMIGNEVCLVVDKKSSLYAPAMMGFNPDIVLIAIPNEKVEERVLSIATQAKAKNIPYVFYTPYFSQGLDCINQMDVYRNCKAILTPYNKGRRWAKSGDGQPTIISIVHEMEVIKRLKELA